jgi:chromosome segregation ATPase
MFISPVIYAQSTIPKLDELSSRTRQNIKKTKDIISKTQSKIELIRSQNEIRTREIEGLTTKVGSIITKMSGQGKDNSALQSEILVSNELLNIERNTTKKLKQDNTKLIKKIASITEKNRQSFTKLTADYELIIVRMKNLKASLSLEKTKHLKLKNKNKVLEKKITKEKRNTRIVRANYENKILEKQSKLNQLGNKIKAYEKLIEKTTKIQENIPKK